MFIKQREHLHVLIEATVCVQYDGRRAIRQIHLSPRQTKIYNVAIYIS